MTRYQLMPNLTLDEYESLKDDITARGVMVAVEVDEAGMILDGHNRAAIAQELGIDYPTVTRAGLTEDQKVEHVLALNLDRRQLTREQRAELVATLRRQRMSLRRIAEVTHLPRSTVERDLSNVPSGTLPETIETTDGRSYPAHRPDPDLLAFREQRMAADPRIQLAELQLRWGKVALRLSELVLADPAEYVPHLDRDDLETLPGLIASARRWLDRIEAETAAVGRPRLIGGGQA